MDKNELKKLKRKIRYQKHKLEKSLSEKKSEEGNLFSKTFQNEKFL